MSRVDPLRDPGHSIVTYSPTAAAIAMTSRRTGVLLAVTLFAATLAPIGGHAEDAPGAGLSHLTSVTVSISQPSSDAPNCGIEAKPLLAHLERTLTEGGLAIVPKGDASTILSVMTTLDANRGICATGVMLGAYRRVDFYDERAGWLRSGHVVLWQRATQVISTGADHPQATERAVSRLSAELLESRRTADVPARPAR